MFIRTFMQHYATLQELNISMNKLSSLAGLGPGLRLKDLNASEKGLNFMIMWYKYSIDPAYMHLLKFIVHVMLSNRDILNLRYDQLFTC